MRTLSALTCIFLLSVPAAPAPANQGCENGSRCPLSNRLSAAHLFKAGRGMRLRRCCCSPPAGWGFYLRQKLHHDCSAPLVIDSETGGVTLIREPR